MDPCHRRSRSGQAAPEYVALLALVAVVVAAAGAAVAAADSGLPRALVHAVRVAVCMVGGDICRAGDAERAGLEPCVVGAREYARQSGGTAYFVGASHESAWRVERRPDGSHRITVSADRRLGADFGVSVGIGRRGEATAGVHQGIGFRSGFEWELADAAAVRAFFARAPSPERIKRDGDWRFLGLPEPTARFRDGGALGSLQAGVSAGISLPLLSGGRRRALGRRIGRDGTTWYFDASDTAVRIFGGAVPEIALGDDQRWSLEVDEDGRGRARRLVLRGSVVRGEEVRVTTAVLDLRRPGNAAAARDLLALRGGAWNPLAIARATRVGRHLIQTGAVQHDRYVVEELPSGPDVDLAAAVGGVSIRSTASRRRLVRSEVIGPDGARRVRGDCLPHVAGLS